MYPQPWPTDTTTPELISVADFKAAFGIDPSYTDADAQIALACEIASSLVVTYTGRRLVKNTYKDRFLVTRNDLRLCDVAAPFHLSEFPLYELVSITHEASAQEHDPHYVQYASGIVGVSGIMPDAAYLVEFIGGFDPLPAVLRGALLDMTRRQLEALGVDLSSASSQLKPSQVPARAVTIGQLRVEYAISLTAISTQGATSPFLTDMLSNYESVLDPFVHPRKQAAVA